MYNEKLKHICSLIEESTVLKYLDTKLNIYSFNDTIHSKTINFLEPYFAVDKNIEKTNATGNIYFFPYDLINTVVDIDKFICAEEIVIRKSDAKEFDLRAKKIIDGDYQLFQYIQNQTYIIIDKKNADVYCFVSNNSFIPMIEFIRDLVIKDLENKGAFVIHAAAFELDGEIVLISGNKGAGKSTFLFKMINEHKCKLVSGDKVIGKIINDRLYLKGWPDYPHLGIGTIKNNSMLYENLKDKNIDNKSDKDKILIIPSELYEKCNIQLESKFLPLKYIIFPDVSKQVNNIIKIDNVTEKLLDQLEFKNDFEICKWYEFIEINKNKKYVIDNIIKKVRCIGYQIEGKVNNLKNLL